MTASVDLAADAEVRAFVEMVDRQYADVELTAQRTHQQTPRTTREFRSAVLETLTARQSEVLQTAYFNGYFEEPRTRNASGIADTLDISQPTFNGHARAAQRKIFAHLFEEYALQV